MAGIDHGDPELLGLDTGVVWSLTDDQRIHTGCRGFA
jgi:hypothetical protein